MARKPQIWLFRRICGHWRIERAAQRGHPDAPKAKAWLAEHGEKLATLPSPHLSSRALLHPAAARAQKQASDRARDEKRKGTRKRVRPPRRYVETDDGSVEEKDAPKVGIRVRGVAGADGELDELHSLEMDVGPKFWAQVTDADRWMMGRLETMLEEASGDRLEIAADHTATRKPGDRAPGHRIDQLHRAYLAAFGCAPEHEWERQLRGYVEHTLHAVLGKPGPKGAKVDLDPTGFVLSLRFSCPKGSVPQWLNGKVIEDILKTSTLTRGAPRAGGRRNYHHVVDDLIHKHGGTPRAREK